MFFPWNQGFWSFSKIEVQHLWWSHWLLLPKLRARLQFWKKQPPHNDNSPFSSHIRTSHFATKKMVKKDQPSPQKWSEENTAAYMGSHHQLDDQHKDLIIDVYIDHLGGRLTMDVPTYWAALKAGISTVQSGRVPNCECSIEICSWMCHCLFLSTLHPGILSAELGTVTSWIRMTSVTSDPSILCSDCRSKHVWQLELVDLCKCPVGRADKTAGFGDAWGEWGGNGSVGWVGWAPTLQIPQLNALLSKQRHTLETTIIAIMILGNDGMQSILSICMCFDCCSSNYLVQGRSHSRSKGAI